MSSETHVSEPGHGLVILPSAGLILHSPTAYDLLVSLLTRGRERAFRERLTELARLRLGESVLDVGCGTGSLAIAAGRRVGPTGSVHGIDASPEMLTRADGKSKRAGVEVAFENAMAQALPFGDARFDAVLSTVMMHHLPRKARAQCVVEIRRVLKPGGRVLVVEFGSSPGERKGLLAHLHRHGHVRPPEIIDLLTEAGLAIVESGPVGIRDLEFVLATKAGAE